MAAWLDDLRARGFTVVQEGDSLRVTPAHALTAEDRAAIHEHKAELLAVLLAADPERAPFISAYARWFLVRGVDPLDETTVLEVYDVFTGTLPQWSAWLDTAPLEDLRRGLRLIQQEHLLLGERSPWRNE